MLKGKNKYSLKRKGSISTRFRYDTDFEMIR